MPGPKTGIHILSCVFLLCLFNLPGGFAQDRSLKDRLVEDEDVPFEIEAKYMKLREEIYDLKGDIVVKRADQTLHAEEGTYDKESGIAKVKGDIRFEVAGDVLECEEGVFNLEEQTGQVSRAHLFLRESRYSISGEKIEKLGADTYSIEDGRLTTCDGEPSDWSITGSKIDFTMEKYGTIRDFAFRVREFPIFYLPYLIFPAKTERQTGLLLPKADYSDRNGVSMEVPFFWAISDQTDATFYARYMSERGYMQGLEFRYIDNQDSKGVFLFDILSDDIEKKDLNDPEQVEVSPFPRTNRTRYWLRGRMDQDLPQDMLARLDLDYVSDQDYLREFEGDLFGFEARPDLRDESGRPLDERYSPARRSSLRLSHEGEFYSLQGASFYHQLPENPSEDETTQPLGALNYAFLPQRVPHFPIFYSLDMDYQYTWREVGSKGHGFSFSPELSYPMWLGKHLSLVSSIDYTGSMEWFDDPLEGKDHQFKDAYRAQTGLSTIFERIFGVEWGSIKRVKHKITPSLTYDYGVFPDEREESLWFNPLDRDSKVNRIVFSVENLLDARMENEKGEVSYRQLVRFSLSQGYNIDEARRDKGPMEEKKEAFEPLLAAMILRPLPGLYFVGRAEWDYETDKVTTVDLSLDLSVPRSGNRRDRYALDYVKVENGNRSLKFLADVNLSHGFSAGASINRNLDLKHDIRNGFWMEYESQCWALQVGMEEEEAGTRFMLSVRLLGFNW
ncbi:MAG: LPS-assembly protein LptD [Deltaproteobacteria bacterium]|nr:LPS-assembly protein LptD [Deltaproteobacteria bacterium]